jgi:parvulin-like peptidyl-prolyl isomerase
MKTLVVAAATASLILSCGGCIFHNEAPQPLTGDAFIAKRVQGRLDPQPIDRPGQVIVEGVNPPAPAQPVPAGRNAPRSPTDISPAVRESVRAPGDADPNANLRASTQPRPRAVRSTPATNSATSASDPSGQYVVLGTVLAQVSSRPIYAHRVLAVLDTALRAEAERYADDARGFRAAAAELIGKQIRTEEQNELVFAVAEKSLDAREKKFAEQLTTQWQNDESNKAGGSIELAKRKWAEQGWDFSERLDYQYRVFLTRLFWQRRVFPLVNVTASDIRRYYDKNKDTPEFTHAAEARFRIVKIDSKQLKLPEGAEEAKKIATDVHDRAANGENFEALARQVNDPGLKDSGGYAGTNNGWLPRNTFRSQKLEDAVWSLEPGQVTSVIEDGGVFYVAKLEERRDAVTDKFENPEVQQRIDEKLKGRQFKELEEQRQAQFMKDAVIQENPKMLQIALDMAMQRYAAWKSVAASGPPETK